MSRPSRRGVLRGIATLSAAGALPTVAATSTGSGLIQACVRYLELEQLVNDPARDGPFVDCSAIPECREYVALVGVLETAIPRSIAEVAAMARVALYSADSDTWDDTTALRVAYSRWHGFAVRWRHEPQEDPSRALSGWGRRGQIAPRLAQPSSRRCSPGHIAPSAERGAAGLAVLVGGQAVTTELEVVVDPAMGGEESLCMTR